jgi:hypothetical protein
VRAFRYLSLFKNMSNFMKKPNIIVHLDVSPEESLRRIQMVSSPTSSPAAPVPYPRAEEVPNGHRGSSSSSSSSSTVCVWGGWAWAGPDTRLSMGCLWALLSVTNRKLIAGARQHATCAAVPCVPACVGGS